VIEVRGFELPVRLAACLTVVFLVACTNQSGAWNWSLLPTPLIDQLSKEDIRLADDTLQKALEVAMSGVTFTWENTANGHTGTVTPKASFQTASGQFCRDYVETVTISSRTELYENSACKESAGLWLPTS